MVHPAIQIIQDTFQTHGTKFYGMEAVTQLEHALQSGDLAKERGGSDAVVAACLLHDIGHILDGKIFAASLEENLHDHHEDKGALFLQRYFGDAVADPVRLHVRAKRYICTKNPSYVDVLSRTSKKSFEDQGGMMSEDEVKEFEAQRYHEDSVFLRKVDDIAKVQGKVTAALEDYIPMLEGLLIVQ